MTRKLDFEKLGPLAVVWDGVKNCGDIFRIQLFNQHVTFMVGPAANAVFFQASDEDLSQQEVYRFTVPVFGKDVVYDAPLKVMHQQLKFVSTGLTKANMEAHCENIVFEAEQFLSKLPESGEIELFSFFSGSWGLELSSHSTHRNPLCDCRTCDQHRISLPAWSRNP